MRVAQTLLNVYYAFMLEYRAEIILWIFTGTFPIIFMGVWMKASEGGQFGFSAIEFARYFIAVFLVRQFNIVWVVWEFEKEVVRGTLSNRLLQPIDPVWHHFAQHVSERLTRLPFLLLLLAVFFVVYPQAFWVPGWSRILLALLVCCMAFCLRFVMQYTSAMMAFWAERANAIEQLMLMPYFFLSGLVAPLSVYPDAVREVIMWTPFPYMIFFPAALLVGIPVNIGRGLLTILGWGIIFFTLNRFLWRLGLKKYSGMGA
jgi:ABC-2 type transport system permease protein